MAGNVGVGICAIKPAVYSAAGCGGRSNHDLEQGGAEEVRNFVSLLQYQSGTRRWSRNEAQAQRGQEAVRGSRAQLMRMGSIVPRPAIVQRSSAWAWRTSITTAFSQLHTSGRHASKAVAPPFFPLFRALSRPDDLDSMAEATNEAIFIISRTTTASQPGGSMHRILIYLLVKVVSCQPREP